MSSTVAKKSMEQQSDIVLDFTEKGVKTPTIIDHEPLMANTILSLYSTQSSCFFYSPASTGETVYVR